MGFYGIHQARASLLKDDAARVFPGASLVDLMIKPLLSDEHFSLKGKVIDAWAV